jgi:hypothetical protein
MLASVNGFAAAAGRAICWRYRDCRSVQPAGMAECVPEGGGARRRTVPLGLRRLTGALRPEVAGCAAGCSGGGLLESASCAAGCGIRH